jgi:6-phosphogluconolactonase (cycloisomerase 2 family)
MHMKNRLALLLVLALAGVLLSSLPAHADSNPLKFVGVNIDMGIFVASSAALSPDEKFVYVAAYLSDSVSVFQRDGTSGKLAFVEAIRNGAGVGDSLNGATSVTVSPDGGNVYVTAGNSDAVTVFSRNPDTGRLTYLEVHKQGAGGITSLNGPNHITVSPDNKHVYVASAVSNTVTVFNRNLPAGTLSLLEVHQDGVGGVDGLNMANAISFSPEGNHLYVTGAGDDAVTVFSRNQVNGSLTHLSTYKGDDIGPGYLDGADSVAVSPDGVNVYVTSIADKGLAVFNRNGSTGLLTFTEVHRDGINGVSGLARPEMVKGAPDGKNVYVVGYGGGNHGQLAVFERNPTNGALTYLGKLLNGSGGLSAMFAPISLVLTSDNSYLHVPSNLALLTFKRNNMDGTLTLVEEYRSANGIQGPVGIAVWPEGCLFVAGAKDNAISVFKINNLATGLLIYHNIITNGDPGIPPVEGLTSARAVAVSSDGHFIYVAGHDDNAVAMFTKSTGSCSMTFVAAYKSTDPGVAGLNGPQSLTLSPDEKHLYVASEISNSVAIFSRNPTSGTLTFTGFVQNGGPVQGLGGAYSIAISPNNRHAYVTGYTDDSLAVFSRSLSNGSLTFLEVHRDGVGGVDGLNGANSVAVSPDGAHVYVAGRLDAAVATFSRNPTSGTLTYQGMAKNGVNGVTGLNGARALAVSPDGKQVYVASQFDDALAVFSRDPISGALTLAGVHQNGVNGVKGLNTANGIAVSPTGSHIYVSGFDDNAIAVFSRFNTSLPLIMKEP